MKSFKKFMRKWQKHQFPSQTCIHKYKCIDRIPFHNKCKIRHECLAKKHLCTLLTGNVRLRTWTTMATPLPYMYIALINLADPWQFLLAVTPKRSYQWFWLVEHSVAAWHHSTITTRIHRSLANLGYRGQRCSHCSLHMANFCYSWSTSVISVCYQSHIM